MAQRHIVFRPATQPGDVAQQLAARFEAVRREFEVPDRFPPAVVAEASSPPRPPPCRSGTRRTSRSSPSTRRPRWTSTRPCRSSAHGEGYRVRYAIADVPAFVRAGGAVDAEARRRGQTVYCPDERIQLHPPS